MGRRDVEEREGSCGSGGKSGCERENRKVVKVVKRSGYEKEKRKGCEEGDWENEENNCYERECRKCSEEGGCERVKRMVMKGENGKCEKVWN